MKKKIYLTGIAILFLFSNSCQDGWFHSDNDWQLKSSEIKKKEIVEKFKTWFTDNPDSNNFRILEWSIEIKWNNAHFVKTNTAIILEVPIKLKNKFKTVTKDDAGTNIDQRLFFIKENGVITSYIEYILAKKELSYLADIEKVNYSKLDENFVGTIILENTRNEIKIIYNSEAGGKGNRLKSAAEMQIICVCLVELYSDGTYEIIDVLYCYERDAPGGGIETGGGTGSGETAPAECDCNVCQVCGGCLEVPLLKSLPHPDDDEGTDETLYDCPMCSCLPLPVVDATDLEQNPKANCVYQNLLNGEILQDFIARYYAPSEQNQSFLGELNLTWTLGSTTETFPIGVPRNGTYYSVEIRLNESAINSNSVTNVAISILHEALHAKLIAEFYDQKRTTDFLTLYANYRGQDLLGIDKEQEKIMLETYFEDLATGLRDFDQSQGIYNTLEFYKKAVRYDLIYEIYGEGSSQEDYNAYLELINSSKNCY